MKKKLDLALNKFKDEGKKDALASMLNTWSLSASNHFYFDDLYKVPMIKSDPDAYLDILRNDSECKKPELWLISSPRLKTLSEEQPEIMTKVESLYSEGSKAAAVLLARIASSNENWEQLNQIVEKNYDILKHAYPVVRTSDKYEELSSVLSKPILQTLTNKLMAKLLHDKDPVKEVNKVLQVAKTRNICLEDLDTSVLKHLSKFELDYSKELKKILELRN